MKPTTTLRVFKSLRLEWRVCPDPGHFLHYFWVVDRGVVGGHTMSAEFLTVEDGLLVLVPYGPTERDLDLARDLMSEGHVASEVDFEFTAVLNPKGGIICTVCSVALDGYRGARELLRVIVEAIHAEG